MIGSKANDVESKLLSDWKSAGEGPTCDCLCDTFFQFVLGMRIKTVSDSQVKNVEKLLDYLPTIDENMNSMLGPLLACNRGYGKKSILGLLASKHYKVIMIASKIGSEHPIVGSSIVESYIEKIERNNLSNSGISTIDLQSNYGVLQSTAESFRDSYQQITMCDNSGLLLRPEAMVAQHREKPTLYAFGYRDIYDKKWSKSYCDFLFMAFLMWIISSTPGFAFQR
jgi:hypothetical protein